MSRVEKIGILSIVVIVAAFGIYLLIIYKGSNFLYKLVA